MSLLFIACSNVCASERPALTVQTSPLSVASLSDSSSEPPSLTSANSSPMSLSPATPTYQMSPKSCGLCGQAFVSDEGTSGRIKRHLKSSCVKQHPSKKDKFPCSSNGCVKVFSRSDSRLDHERKKHEHLNRRSKKTKATGQDLQ
jgi:hypothetical protein